MSDRLVGVIGDPDASPPAAVAAAVRDVADATCQGSPTEVLSANPAAVVACGHAATVAVGRRAPSVPVVAVDAGPGFRSVDQTAVGDAVVAVLAGECRIERTPVLAVERDGETLGRSVADVTLLAAEPARIAGFAVAAEDPVAEVRADGVVVATAAGAPGYARAVDAPLLCPDAPVVAGAPVAPFATDADAWVLPADRTSVRVVRDGPVTLLIDGDTVATLQAGARLDTALVGWLPQAVVPASSSRYADRPPRLERH